MFSEQIILFGWSRGKDVACCALHDRTQDCEQGKHVISLEMFFDLIQDLSGVVHFVDRSMIGYGYMVKKQSILKLLLRYAARLELFEIVPCDPGCMTTFFRDRYPAEGCSVVCCSVQLDTDTSYGKIV